MADEGNILSLDELKAMNASMGASPTAQPTEPTELLSLDQLKELGRKQDIERDPLGEIKAGAAGLARGLSFGLSDVGLTGTGLVEKSTLRGLEEAFPKSSLGGEAFGILAPTIASGGSSLLARGAVKAGAGVLGVGKIGQIAEGVVAKNLLKTASQSGAKKALSSAAAKGIGSGIEGSFYGAGQVISEAALGETPPTADKVLSTIGLSALFSGAFTGGASIGGDILKATAKAVKPQLALLRQNLAGVSKDVEKTILTKADKIEDFGNAYGIGDVDETIFNAYGSKVDDLSKARYESISNVKTEIDDIIKANNLSGKSAEVKPILGVIRNTRSKYLKDVAKAEEALTPELSSLAKTLDTLESRLILNARKAAGVADDVVIDPNDLRILAGDLNDIKAKYSISAEFSPNIKKSVGDKLYDDLYTATNKQLDAIDPAIRKANSVISTSLKAQEALKRYGLYQKGTFDAEKLRKLATTNGPLFAEAKKHLNVLDQNWGTDLLEFAEISRAYKALNPKDALARSFTGRSLLESGVGGVVGGALGGPAGAAIGALGGLAVQSPLATRAKIKGINAVENLLVGPGKKLASSLNANTARFVPDNLTPFLSAQAVALGTLERRVKKVDHEMDSSVKAFLNGNPSSASNSIGALQDSPFDADRRENIGVDKAFERRMQEVSKLASDPAYLDERIREAMLPLTLVAPEMAKYLDGTARRGLAYLNENMPKPPTPGNPFTNSEEYIPSDDELYKFARIVNVTENPMSVMKDLRNGSLTKEAVDTLQAVYPNIYNELQKKIIENAGSKQPKLDFGQLVTLGTLFNIETTQALNPAFMFNLQNNFVEENREAQKASSSNLQGYSRIAQSGMTTGQRIGG